MVGSGLESTNQMGLLGGITVASIGFAWALTHAKKVGTFGPTVATLLVHTFLGLAQFIVLGLRDDQLTYFLLARELAMDLQEDPINAAAKIDQGKASFVWILSALFLVWGDDALPGVMMNVVLMAFLPAIIVVAGRNFRLIQSGRITAWLVALGPPLLIWGPGLKREPLSYLLIALLLLSLSFFYQNKFARGIFLWFVVTGAIALTRSSLVIVPLSGALWVMALLISRSPGSLRKLVEKLLRTPRPGSMAALLTIGAVGAVSNPTALSALGLPTPGRPVQELTIGQATAVPYLEWANEYSLSGALLHWFRVTYNLLRSLIGPMPWEVVNLSLATFWLESAIYVGLLGTLLLVLRQSPNQLSKVSVLVFAAIPLIIANFLWLSNYGLNSRVRSFIYLILVVLIEATFSKGIERRFKSISKYLSWQRL